MAENSKIEWCHHTMNPWRGCTKVSPGCTNCYAEKGSKRNPAVLGVWGPQGTREVAAEAQWRLPVKWDRWARDGVCHRCGGNGCDACDGTGDVGPYRARVFCASLADVFEGPETMPQAAWPGVFRARVRLFHLIAETRQLDWLLLTKRPENVLRFTGAAAESSAASGRSWTESPPPNVWLGASVEDQQRADERIPHLLRAPAAVRFLSVEPLLGPLDLTHWLPRWGCDEFGPGDRGIDWVIVGGESGGHARVFDVAWCEEIVEQCRSHGVACFVKQFGARPAADGQLLQLGGRKGEDLDDWPDHLRVRQFPSVRASV